MSDIFAYHNCRIITMGDSIPYADTLAIHKEKIIRVGSEGEIRRQLPEETKFVDLEGLTIVPGFIDAHCHFVPGAFAPLWLDCSDGKIAKLASVKHSGWIRGRQPPHWYIHPSLKDFDTITPDRPAILVEQGYHGCALNSVARHLLSEGPNGSYFKMLLSRPETHGRGVLTDHPASISQPNPDSSAVLERAMGWAENVSRDWFQEHYETNLLEFVDQRAHQFLAQGVTCVCDAAVTPKMAFLLAKARDANKLPFSVVMLGVGSGGFFEPPWDRLNGLPTGQGDETLQIGALKIFADGGRQCLVELPDGTTRGVAFYDRDSLSRLMLEALQKNFSLACHAMGNGGVSLALDAYTHTISKVPTKYRLRIEHASQLTPELVRRMADLGVIAVIQPHWISWLGRRWLEAPYPHLQFLPFRSLIDAGVTLAGSSDGTDGAVLAPLDSMAAAVSRQVLQDRYLDKDQALTPYETLQMYTCNAALACEVQESRGTLEVGKRADFVILDGDPLDHKELIAGRIRVIATYVAGVPKYTAESGVPEYFRSHKISN